jgi:hypothetical protein
MIISKIKSTKAREDLVDLAWKDKLVPHKELQVHQKGHNLDKAEYNFPEINLRKKAGQGLAAEAIYLEEARSNLLAVG